MNEPMLFPDEGAAALGSNGRTESNAPESTLVRLPLTPPAHHNAPVGTSELAARRMGPHAAQQRADVLAVILKAGAYGATDAEIELVTGIRAQSVSPRRGELRMLGMITDSGRRRKTPRGRDAAVWVTTNHAPNLTAPKTCENFEVRP